MSAKVVINLYEGPEWFEDAADKISRIIEALDMDYVHKNGFTVRSGYDRITGGMVYTYTIDIHREPPANGNDASQDTSS